MVATPTRFREGQSGVRTLADLTRRFVSWAVRCYVRRRRPFALSAAVSLRRFVPGLHMGSPMHHALPDEDGHAN